MMMSTMNLRREAEYAHAGADQQDTEIAVEAGAQPTRPALARLAARAFRAVAPDAHEDIYYPLDVGVLGHSRPAAWTFGPYG